MLQSRHAKGPSIQLVASSASLLKVVAEASLGSSPHLPVSLPFTL